jgi:hypothetical protein
MEMARADISYSAQRAVRQVARDDGLPLGARRRGTTGRGVGTRRVALLTPTAREPAFAGKRRVRDGGVGVRGGSGVDRAAPAGLPLREDPDGARPDLDARHRAEHGRDPSELLRAQRAVFGERCRELAEAAELTEGFERTLALWRLTSTAAALRFCEELLGAGAGRAGECAPGPVPRPCA